MTPKTEEQLNAHIDALNDVITELKEQVEETENERDGLQRKLESDALGWSHPVKLDYNELPLPRLEMRWTRNDSEGYSRACTYMLVYEHFLGRNKIAYADDAAVVGLVLGRTTSSGSPRKTFLEQFIDDPAPKIITPYREWSHALSDSEHLKLPLYITTEDDDVSIVIKNQSEFGGKQTMLKVGGKAL